VNSLIVAINSVSINQSSFINPQVSWRRKAKWCFFLFKTPSPSIVHCLIHEDSQSMDYDNPQFIYQLYHLSISLVQKSPQLLLETPIENDDIATPSTSDRSLGPPTAAGLWLQVIELLQSFGTWSMAHPALTM
jgi:hypothetical protein